MKLWVLVIWAASAPFEPIDAAVYTTMQECEHEAKKWAGKSECFQRVLRFNSAGRSKA